MKFKLDENLGTRTQQLLIDANHDVHTIYAEDLIGTSDNNLYKVCCEERRCLITLDLDFADILRYPPSLSAGIIVIRMLRNPSLHLLSLLIQQVLQFLQQQSVDGQLWIVELGRIRIHQVDND